MVAIFGALNQGSALNPRTLNPGTTVLIIRQSTKEKDYSDLLISFSNFRMKRLKLPRIMTSIVEDIKRHSSSKGVNYPRYMDKNGSRVLSSIE